MATTAIWDVRGYIDNVLSYTVNPDKTRNPDWSEQQQQNMLDVMEQTMQEAQARGLSKVIDYAADDFKTEQQYYVTGLNCDPSSARHDMIATKRQWNKEGGIIAYHGYQSFKTGEVSPDDAHRIGIELAKRLWGNRFEVLVSTHINTRTVHNHFVINSVSFADGKRYYDNKQTQREMRRVSDELCRLNRLTVIDNPSRHSKSRAQWAAEQQGKATWTTAVKMDLEAAIMGAVNFQTFVKNMKERGYEVEKRGEDWRIKPPYHDNFSRLRTIGKEYTYDAIVERIIRQRWPMRPPKPEQQTSVRRIRVYGDFHLSKITLKGLQVLYFYYRHKLREACRQPSSYTPYALREDIRHLEAIDKQTRFLIRHKIVTAEDLTAYQDHAKQQIADLSEERKELKNELRRTDITEPRKAEIKKRLSEITTELRPLRQDVKLCEAIVVRSLIIAEKKAQLKQIEAKEVEKKHEKEQKHGKNYIR